MSESNIIPASGGLSLVDFPITDRAGAVNALSIADRVERMGTTLKLYVIAYCAENFGYQFALESLQAAFSYSESYCGTLIGMAISITTDVLRKAVEQGRELSFEQWRSIAIVPLNKRDGIIEKAVEHDAPPLEIEAAATNKSLQEVAEDKLIKTLRNALRKAEEMALRHRVTAVLEEFGYLPRIIRSGGR